MSSLRKALAVLAVTASLVMSQDVKALVHDLTGPAIASQKASQLLREMPPDVVAAEIARVLKEDREFRLISARVRVYEFMSDLVKERRQQNRSIERPYLEQLKAGLAESNPGLRRTAVETLALVEPAVQKEVARWITPALEDAALDVVAAVADALRRFESRAADSAPALLTLLKDPDEAARKRWAAGQKGSLELWKIYGTEDPELVARQRAAGARLAILGNLADLDLYPTLDERGQLAGAMAIVLRGDKLPSQVGADPARARQAVALVAPLLGNPLVNGEMQWAPVMIWMIVVERLEGESMKEVRADALARIEAASKKANGRVSEKAAQALEGLKTRK